MIFFFIFLKIVLFEEILPLIERCLVCSRDFLCNVFLPSRRRYEIGMCSWFEPSNASIYPSIHPPTHPSIHLYFYFSIFLSIFLSFYLSFYLSIYLSIYLCIYVIYLSKDKSPSKWLVTTSVVSCFRVKLLYSDTGTPCQTAAASSGGLGKWGIWTIFDDFWCGLMIGKYWENDGLLGGREIFGPMFRQTKKRETAQLSERENHKNWLHFA